MKTVFKSIAHTVAMTLKMTTVPLLLLAVVACGKSNDNNNNQNVAAVQYQIVNGQCANTYSNNSIVAMNLCNQVGGVGGLYSFNGNQCIQTQTGQIVDPTYCSNNGLNGYNGGIGYNNGLNTGFGGINAGYGQGYYPNQNYLPYGQGYAIQFGTNHYPSTYGGGTYGGSQQCVGMYYAYEGYTGALRYCDGYSCRGLFLYSQQTRVRVLCL